MALRIEKLAAIHRVGQFDCGRAPLNSFLQKHALANQSMQAAQTYVAVGPDHTVVGFHSLAVGQVDYSDAPERLGKGLARHPVPVMLLARLATSLGHQGQGIGRSLLRDAIARTLQAADIAGIRAMVVHAKDEPAHLFYAHFNFKSWEGNPLQLYLLTKDARLLVRR